MTDSEILQKLIDSDPEFQQLVFEANANTNSLFDRTGEELAATKNFTKFNKYNLEEFYATYKVILGWSAMMGNILNQIHTDLPLQPLHSDTWISIPGTDMKAVVCKSPAPWMVRVYINSDSSALQVCIDEDLMIIDSQQQVVADTPIKFILSAPEIHEPKNIPDLKNSWMNIVIADDSAGNTLYTLQVKDLKPALLTDCFKKYINNLKSMTPLN